MRVLKSGALRGSASAKAGKSAALHDTPAERRISRPNPGADPGPELERSGSGREFS